MKKSIFIALLATAALAGCDSYTAQQYQTSPQNTIALQSVAASGARATVATVALAEGVDGSPSCRLAGPIDLGGGSDAAAAIKQAMLAELLAAGVHSASGTPLTITVTKLEPDSFAGTWTISLTVASAKTSYSVTQVTKYSTSFSAVAACNNTATAFNPALSATILVVVQHPNFRALL